MSGTAKLAVYARHSRQWHNLRYVYPVISRRSGGLSVGINLNPDKACNFDCVYCCVDRTRRTRVPPVDLGILRQELCEVLAQAESGELFRFEPFETIPATLRRLNDVAFSGDGEPTASRLFLAACRAVVEVLAQLDVAAKVVVITNSTRLHLPRVVDALRFLDRHNGELWAKLDAGTEGYYRLINRTNVPLSRVTANILTAGRARPLIIQSMFVRYAGQSPSPAEIRAYVQRLRRLVEGGCRIKTVHVYTTARRVADPLAGPLSDQELDEIAQHVRGTGLEAQTFYSPH